MNLILGAFKNFWLEFYNKCVRNLDDRIKIMVGGICVVVSILIFIMSTKGHDKTKMVNSWFLFWVSLIVFCVALFYLTVAIK